MAAASFGYLTADVIAETGVSDSYLGFLVRVGILWPVKHRNGRTNLFSEDDLETIRWAMARRGELSVGEMRQMVHDVSPDATNTSGCICPAVTQASGGRTEATP